MDLLNLGILHQNNHVRVVADPLLLICSSSQFKTKPQRELLNCPEYARTKDGHQWPGRISRRQTQNAVSNAVIEYQSLNHQSGEDTRAAKFL